MEGAGGVCVRERERKGVGVGVGDEGLALGVGRGRDGWNELDAVRGIASQCRVVDMQWNSIKGFEGSCLQHQPTP